MLLWRHAANMLSRSSDARQFSILIVNQDNLFITLVWIWFIVINIHLILIWRELKFIQLVTCMNIWQLCRGDKQARCIFCGLARWSLDSNSILTCTSVVHPSKIKTLKMSAVGHSLSKSVFVVAAKRTPFGTFGGALKSFTPTDLQVRLRCQISGCLKGQILGSLSW